jgi:hypothetical protein
MLSKEYQKIQMCLQSLTLERFQKKPNTLNGVGVELAKVEVPVEELDTA